jgi:Ca2+-binding EF-hand superfamily protein
MSKYLLAGAMAAAMVAIAPAISQTPASAPVAPKVQDHIGERGWHGRSSIHTRAEVGGHVRSLFDRLDHNRDGYITKAETEAGKGRRGEREKRVERRQGNGGQTADRRGMFDRMDANKDGYISRDEFARAPMREERRVVIRDGKGEDRHIRELGGAGKMRGARVGSLRGRMFERADANRDGRVSLQEATAEAYRHFDLADANRDGRITPEERMQMHQRMRAERRPG